MSTTNSARTMGQLTQLAGGMSNFTATMGQLTQLAPSNPAPGQVEKMELTVERLIRAS